MKEYQKEKIKAYREANKEKIKAYQKVYRENNKEKISEKITCECGSVVRRSDLAKHKKTAKHLKII